MGSSIEMDWSSLTAEQWVWPQLQIRPITIKHLVIETEVGHHLGVLEDLDVPGMRCNANPVVQINFL